MSTFPSDPGAISALYFDGRNAAAHEVRLSQSAGTMDTRGETVERHDAVATLRFSDALGSGPRLIFYSDGAHCEVRDQPGIAQWFAAGGGQASWVAALESRWRWAVLAIVIAVAAVFSTYRWGLPLAADWATRKVPVQWLTQLDDKTLMIMDRTVFSASRLPPVRQQALRARLQRFASASRVDPQPSLEFRRGEHVGANAMALPGGTLIVTDELAALAASDDEIIAVLAHEVGHVERRHGLRMLIEGSVVAFVVSWYIGDVSSVAAGVPTLLLQARYSRAHESEADAYAARTLKSNGLSPALLADMLSKLEQNHRPSAGNAGKASPNRKSEPDITDYLASHPATRERIEALKQ